ncbi:MAG TPA: pyruvate kinase [Polyangiaceae bacterium]|nr:pyruvate kinase [Polyangiaceae bacterium]
MGSTAIDRLRRLVDQFGSQADERVRVAPPGRAVSSKPLPLSPASDSQASLVDLARTLVRLRGSLRSHENEMRRSIERAAPDRRESAKNLVHYLALRQHDLRNLQIHLSQRGLSSLSHCESCVMGSLLEVSERAHESLALQGMPGAKRQLLQLEKERSTTMSWATAKGYLHQHTRDVLGPRPGDRHIYIMVTAAAAAESDRAWMLKMLRAGMNVLRINCAHEGEHEWGQMVRALGEARKESGKDCRVLMDLAGPKIRTGPVASGRHIATWKPRKDSIGKVKAPARVVIHRASAPPVEGSGPFFFVCDEAFAKLRKGDELHFRDARDKKRELAIQAVARDVVVGSSTEHTYVLDRAHARLYRGGEHGDDVTIEVGGDAQDAVIDIKRGDTLLLTRRAVDGTPPRRDREGCVLTPGIIACTLPAALDHLEVGHRVLFDDGRILAIVERAARTRGEFLLRVVRTQKKMARLGPEKGINLPDTLMTVPSLNDEDLRALAFVAKHANAVSLSFVRTPDEVRRLRRELDRLGQPGLGVVLKIETREGFENLPRLLLEGLRRPPFAVMIARGDLAVEVGFERLAELQEEILWLCEASHVPSIWATQVLDTLARTGVPSRAEITDAAASVAAECVMLNKGPFVDEAVAALSDILRRMEKHHYKKRNLFRKLRVSTFAAPLTSGSKNHSPRRTRG